MALKKKATKVKKATKTTKAAAAPKKASKKIASARKAPAKAARATKAAKAKTSVKATKKSSATPAATASKASLAKLPSTAISAKQSKAQIFKEIADITEVNKGDVKKVFAALKNLVERTMKPKGAGQITLPELGVKIKRVEKKATKARMGRNPFTGEEIKIPAKPARKSVRATALKSLKELI